jgi:hypothetical protein
MFQFYLYLRADDIVADFSASDVGNSLLIFITNTFPI